MSDSKIKIREEKWQKKWRDARAFVPVNDGQKPKKYNLWEFPYPSGNSLHVGHMVPMVNLDVLSRFDRKRGFDVLYAHGYDSLGISAEHYATKMGMHPSESVKIAIQAFTKDAEIMGLSYNPESVIATSDPEFIKWTQWMFIRLFNAGLAYKSMMPMNWCPSCKTTLTNEELTDGKCDRCKGPVEEKMKEQWNLAITKYADRLIDDLATVDYPENVKTAQINWIGRSYGADIDFKVKGGRVSPPLGGSVGVADEGGLLSDIITVYTTRFDTVFGVTFMVIAPEHKLVAKWLAEGRIKNTDEVRAYINEIKNKSEFDRTDATKEKTGVRLDGIAALNPFSGAEIPVFIADYVLADYGTGAVMGMPANDKRDREFANKFGLPIIQVIGGGDPDDDHRDGPHINSGFMNGLNNADATAAALKLGEEGGFAKGTKRYKLHDWAFSRQMYWGEPIPLVHCEKCGWVPVPDDQLPLIQPYMKDYRPTEDGEGPLARMPEWVNTTCPKCGGPGKRETDTMPGWAGSSWYFLRYLDPKNDKEFCSREQMDKWMPVDHYTGGGDHITRHMIYSRFWYKALYDLGLVPGVEPYKKRTINGTLLGADGTKMGKSNPQYAVPVADGVNRAGADACRMTIQFLGPFGSNVNWSEDTLTGISRFLKRVESLAENLTDGAMDAEQERLVNQLIYDMTDRIENMRFNTAISAMMEFVNEFGNGMPRRAYETLLQVLNPFAPHLTEEMWEKLGRRDMLVFEPWPVADACKLRRATQTIGVSVNGKHRAEITVSTDAANATITDAARDAVSKYLTGEIAKTIVVPGRMVNFVVK